MEGAAARKYLPSPSSSRIGPALDICPGLTPTPDKTSVLSIRASQTLSSIAAILVANRGRSRKSPTPRLMALLFICGSSDPDTRHTVDLELAWRIWLHSEYAVPDDGS